MADPDIFALPSYEAARLPDAWPYIVSHIPRRSLLSLALTSRKLRGLAQGLLWSEPRRYWNHDGENVVDELHHFMEAVSLSQRLGGKPHLYTQILDLSYLGSESLSFSHSWPRAWASKLLLQLPNLRSFIVSYSQAFDHSALAQAPKALDQLRLLSIKSCENLTPSALSALLGAAHNLYYLELCDCPRLRSQRVIEEIAGLAKLGILKLAGSRWKDEDILTLARLVITSRADPNNPFPQNIRSLDLTNNALSDDVVQTLKFLGEALPSEGEPPPYDADDLDDIESGSLIGSPEGGWSAFFEPRLASKDEQSCFSDKVADVVKEVRCPGFLSPVEAGHLGNGITNLYLSGNRLSASGVISLLQALPLEELDCGDITSITTSTTADSSAIPADVSSARLILDAIGDCPTLKRLRADHRTVTGFVDCESEASRTTTQSKGPSPYPYSWLRHQGTQWDPMLMQNLSVKMFQFSPALLAIKEIVLTFMPHKTASRDFVKCLTSFTDAAGEMQSMIEQYERRKDGRKPHAKHRSGLQRLVLETCRPANATDRYEDDAKAYVNAGVKDFSFFPDEKEALASTSGLQGTLSQDNTASAPSSGSLGLEAQVTAHRALSRWSGELVVKHVQPNIDRAR